MSLMMASSFRRRDRPLPRGRASFLCGTLKLLGPRQQLRSLLDFPEPFVSTRELHVQTAILVVGNLQLEQRDCRGIVLLLHIRTCEREARTRIPRIETGCTFQKRDRVVHALQLEQRLAAHREELRIVTAILEERLKRR